MGHLELQFVLGTRKKVTPPPPARGSLYLFFYFCALSLSQWMLILLVFRYRQTPTSSQFRITSLQVGVMLACSFNLLLMNILRGRANLSANIMLRMDFASTNSLASFTIPRFTPLQFHQELFHQLACLLSR
jgi:hypothetical protein